jgi:hypothetical protein
MAISERFVRAVLPTSLTTVYTFVGPVTARGAIRYITINNRNEDDWLRWWFYIVPSGGNADNSNALASGEKQKRIPPGKNGDYNTWKVMHPGDTIQVYCDGEATIFVDGARRV